MLGLSLSMVAVSLPALAIDLPPPQSWAELTVQRERLEKQFQSHVAAGKTDEAMAVAERLIETDRRLIESSGKRTRIKEAPAGMSRGSVRQTSAGWLSSIASVQAWSAAGKLQQELVDFCEATYGKADFRVIDAHNEKAYLWRLMALTLMRPSSSQKPIKPN